MTIRNYLTKTREAFEHNVIPLGCFGTLAFSGAVIVSGLTYLANSGPEVVRGDFHGFPSILVEYGTESRLTINKLNEENFRPSQGQIEARDGGILGEYDGNLDNVDTYLPIESELWEYLTPEHLEEAYDNLRQKGGEEQ